MGLLLPPGVGPPFRPDLKVKLDKTEARRGGLFLRRGFLGCPLVQGDGVRNSSPDLTNPLIRKERE